MRRCEPRKQMMRVCVIRHGFARFCPLHQRDDARRAAVYVLFPQGSRGDRALDLMIVIRTYIGHLQIQTGGNAE